MKRFLFWFVVVLAAVVLLRANERGRHEVRNARSVVIHRVNGSGGPHQVVVVGRNGGKVVSIDERGITVVDRGTPVVRNTLRPRQVERDVDDADEADDDGATPDVQLPERVFVDDLPVPVVPGSRVTEAQATPPKPPAPPTPPRARVHVRAVRPPVPPVPPTPHVAPRPPAPPTPPADPLVVKGRRSATEDRARDDARNLFVQEIRRRIEPDVPKGWPIPEPMTDGLIRQVSIRPIERDYGTVYEAELTAAFGPAQRAEIVEAYRHEQTVKKLWVLASLFAAVLIGLAAVSGYIRADEATKGYYTNRLRLATAVGAGAAGVALYRWLA